MRVSFEISIVFFSICYYYYYHHYFIPSRRWFLTYICSNFENTLFGLILSFLLNPFMPQIYAYMFFFSFFSFIFSFYIHFSFMIFIIIIIINVYVFSTCTGLFEKRIRFPQGLSLLFRTFYFCIVELWVLVNLKCKKKQNIIRI